METTDAADGSTEDGTTFGVYAELEGHSSPLLMFELSFARLLDEIVKPYEEDEPFFLDGAPATRSRIRKLKIVRLKPGFGQTYRLLNTQLHRGAIEVQKVVGAQYNLRVEAILRQYGEDVTAQVIKAYVVKVKPNLKNYLPKRDEVVSLASKFFFETLKSMSGIP